MTRGSHTYRPFLCALLLPLALTAPTVADAPKAKVNGTLSEIKGVPVVRVWGTPDERGYAYGYLLSADIARFMNEFFADGSVVDVKSYETRVLRKLHLMEIQPPYEAELRAMLRGIETKAGGPVDMPALGRPLQFADLVAANSMGDMLRMGCSSFSAWGDMTKDGHTITGRNMDWSKCPAFDGTQLVMVFVPEEGGDSLGWVSVFWPGLIGCTTGMNAEGVSVAMHDSNSPNPSGTGGFTPSTMLYRQVIESTRAETMVEDITRVLTERHTLPGYNMMATRPYTGSGVPAVVIEHDADLSNGGGLTVREPAGTDAFIACTNHSRKRYDPVRCSRYPKLSDALGKIAGRKGGGHLTVKKAWSMLADVPIESIITHHSAVFEPNKKLMHIALATDGKNAPKCKKITLDVAKLIAGDYPGGK